jgi:catechol 2,3-dioxygenase-like lactoylglutathione lyase family enzyme
MKRYRTTNFFRLCAFAFAVITLAQAAGAQVNAVVRVGMTVDDMDRSLAFYGDVLNFKKVSDIEVAGPEWESLTGVFGLRARIVQLQLGTETIELTQYLTPQGRLIPRDSRSNDRWFQHIAIVVSDMDRAFQHLRKNRVKFASTGPQRLPDWNKNAGGIKAFYFRDPDDHVLEIIYFPPGKGDARWQGGDNLFLGIDHTAIVVADTDKSLEFYRDLLGMKVAGGSENYGDEQAHLNNVRDVRLKITTLRAADGPGVELLQYVEPGAGRPYPSDSKANDLWHWQTSAEVNNVDEIYNHITQKDHRTVSEAVTGKQASTLPGSRAVIVRDPDGHAVQLIQR